MSSAKSCPAGGADVDALGEKLFESMEASEWGDSGDLSNGFGRISRPKLLGEAAVGVGASTISSLALPVGDVSGFGCLKWPRPAAAAVLDSAMARLVGEPEVSAGGHIDAVIVDFLPLADTSTESCNATTAFSASACLS